MRRAVVLILCLGGATWGCQSDAAEICEKLDACHLYPTDPKGKHDFTEEDCESQVENELNSSEREKCASCVSSHKCEEIQDACRSVCNPPY